MAERMHILVEGVTERTIARNIIEPYLQTLGWWATSSIIRTAPPAAGPGHQGGVVSWSQVEREVRRLLGTPSFKYVTTILDYYAFPADAPGMIDRPRGSSVDRVRHVEQALRQHFEAWRFIPHLTLHETETWVFAARDQLAELYEDPAIADRLRADVDAAGGEELINDGPDTAPSKRLKRHCPGYLKTSDGPLVISELGLNELRARCPHLDAWLRLLSQLRE